MTQVPHIRTAGMDNVILYSLHRVSHQKPSADVTGWYLDRVRVERRDGENKNTWNIPCQQWFEKYLDGAAEVAEFPRKGTVVIC